MNQTAQKPAWAFEVIGDGGVAGMLTVHRGTGHWSNKFNVETGEIGEGVYVYEATFDGTAHRYELVITRNDLLKLRRHEKRQSAALRGPEGEVRP